jgi:hypothetical protein
MAFLDRFSLDDLERYSVWCRWALWIPAFIIVLLTFVSHKISDRILVLQGAGKAKSQERQKLTEQQLAKARAQAEQANDRAEELEAKQRPRTVTAEQDAALRAAIHRLFASGLHVPIIIAPRCLIQRARIILIRLQQRSQVPAEAQAFSPAGIFPFQGESAPAASLSH